METRAHDPLHFTQGLVSVNGRLFESTGQYGRSGVHELEPSTGRVMRSQALPQMVFGEGLAYAGQRLIQVSWREQTAFFYDLDLKPKGTMRYPGEGWGLTTMPSEDGEQIVLSDGSPWLKFLEPDTLTEIRRMSVSVRGQPLKLINELEFVRGEILANIWHSDEVAAVDPATGVVRGWFNFAPLRQKLVWPEGPRSHENDLNGLAWNEHTQRLLITGKLWPQLFEVEIGGCRVMPPPR